MTTLIHATRYFVFLSVACYGVQYAYPQSWQRFVIDDTGRGADGAKLADANGDGLLDIVTGWEESGRTRAYFHPGVERVQQPWPHVDVGPAPAVEDAVWVDLNADGRLDVLSCCEGQEQSLRAHLAPPVSRLRDPSAWSTQVIAASQYKTRWMFAAANPRPSGSRSAKAGSSPTVIAAGSKNPNGLVGLLAFSKEEDRWLFHQLAEADWIMSLQWVDIDRDQDLDLLYSDRKGGASGVYWLENLLGVAPEDPRLWRPSSWRKNLLGALGKEVMFIADAKSTWRDSTTTDSQAEIIVAVKPNWIVRLSQASDPRHHWKEEILPVEPREAIGTAKGLALGDLDLDGRAELVFSCEGAVDSKSGLVYLRQSDHDSTWQLHDVSGPSGIKFDLVELVDMDDDGDLDILTCEEREGGRGLGVVWYANPRR